MLIEAIGKPIRYKWPGGEIRLVPGQPVNLPEDRARKILAKAPGRVRSINPAPDFEALKWELWPKLSHCGWCKLTPAEQGRWEIAVKIQGRAEKAGDISRWLEMADILLEIAGAVAARWEEKKVGDT